MISYTKRYVNIVSLLITIILYTFVNNSGYILSRIDFKFTTISDLFKKNIVVVQMRTDNINQNTKEKQNNHINLLTNEKITQDENIKSNWKIVIPKISLEATIEESTSQEIMNKYVGHFEETSKTTGNIGLAAHNRGYEVNYFSQIKILKEGDEIIYKYNEFEKTYTVTSNKIIEDTDWSSLEGTKENKITLITCVENQKEYRRCIQGVEKEEIKN